MKVLIELIVIISFFNLITAELQLKLVNVVFRHGDRTPTPSAIFPTDPLYNSDFYPYGLGSLTNTGKFRSYKLGEFLRERYKNFLGDIYLPELLYARSSDYDRTKMSLQLVLAALFPPTDLQKWSSTLNWQPIPINYASVKNDDILGAVYLHKFQLERRRVERLEDVQERMNDFRDFMSELSVLTGKEIKNTLGIKRIYETLTCEKFMNYTLPEWTKNIYPDGKLLEGILLEYNLVSYDNRITSALGGKLMLKITTDMTDVKNITENRRKKLFLYSGHEVNIVSVLRSLNVFQAHVPEYSSAVIIELLEDDNEYFIKILYYNGVSTKLTELQIPGCSVICPFHKYLDTVKEVLELSQ